MEFRAFAHVLSISGVHLALAGLGVFWALRALLALWPRIALTLPIKKWAALGAFAGFYILSTPSAAAESPATIVPGLMLIDDAAGRHAGSPCENFQSRSVTMAALVIPDLPAGKHD